MAKLTDIYSAVHSDSCARPSAVLVLSGEVDIANSPQLARQLHDLMDSGEVRVVVDMADVEFIDASGIGALVDAARRARAEGGGLELSRPTHMLPRVLDVLQLDGVLPVVGNDEETAWVRKSR